jgi:hypothetical protein
MWVGILKDPQHNSVNDLDKVIGFEVNSPLAERFADGCLILVFMHKLSQHELSSN